MNVVQTIDARGGQVALNRLNRSIQQIRTVDVAAIMAAAVKR